MDTKALTLIAKILEPFLETKSNKTHYGWILFPGFDCKGVTKSASFWNFHPFQETKSNKAHYHWILFPGCMGLTDKGPLFWYWKHNPKKRITVGFYFQNLVIRAWISCPGFVCMTLRRKVHHLGTYADFWKQNPKKRVTVGFCFQNLGKRV